MTDTRTQLSMDPGAFAVSPELAAQTFTELSRLQDTVGEMVREARALGRTVPLGGGYAGEIGDFMATYGVSGPGSAAESLIRFGQELQKLKDNIQQALRRYQATDSDAAGGVDCHGG
ncbi:MAG TPA: hypothetical protein VJT49_31450 [Amycolatopsis sp.]|uniref:hypothetical protein n=1 Tax=Amycolatopsis sp. TaxID=37632 RepID=UPI002B473DA4|nr:hypothetical protein [Amycolatopsis sp.]HKS49547.1 hypothetical protein [Amycolatopsis sp.]